MDWNDKRYKLYLSLMKIPASHKGSKKAYQNFIKELRKNSNEIGKVAHALYTEVELLPFCKELLELIKQDPKTSSSLKEHLKKDKRKDCTSAAIDQNLLSQTSDAISNRSIKF